MNFQNGLFLNSKYKATHRWAKSIQSQTHNKQGNSLQLPNQYSKSNPLELKKLPPYVPITNKDVP